MKKISTEFQSFVNFLAIKYRECRSLQILQNGNNNLPFTLMSKGKEELLFPWFYVETVQFLLIKKLIFNFFKAVKYEGAQVA